MTAVGAAVESTAPPATRAEVVQRVVEGALDAVVQRRRALRRRELGHVAVALTVGRELQALDDSKEFWPEDCSTLPPWAFVVPERLPGLVREVHKLFAVELREWAKQAGRELLEWPAELKDLREFFGLEYQP